MRTYYYHEIWHFHSSKWWVELGKKLSYNWPQAFYATGIDFNYFKKANSPVIAKARSIDIYTSNNKKIWENDTFKVDIYTK